MKTNQKVSLMFAGILALVLFLNFASATLTIGTILELSITGDSFTFELTSDQNESVNIYLDPITNNKGQTIVFYGQSVLTEAGNVSVISIEYNASNFDFEFGEFYSTTIYFDGEISENTSLEVHFESADFCEDCLNQEELVLDIKDVNVINGFGDDNNYLYPLDEVEVEVKVDNAGDWDIDNIEIEWALYTTSGKKIMDDTLSDFNLKDGKDERLTFTFVLDEDVDELEDEDVILYVRAKGTIDDHDSPHDNEDTCDSDSVEVEMKTENDFVILTDFKINGVSLDDSTFDELVLCDQEITITAEAWNIGSDDQQEVAFLIYNSDLDISEMIQIGDIDAYEKEEISFSFEIPKDAEEKWYSLDFEVYDEEGNIYENSEDDESKFDVLFEVEGNCVFLIEPAITAELVSETVKESGEFTIKFTITNPDEEKTASYFLNAADYADWATFVDMSETTFDLVAGESKEVTITFETKKDSAGERFFNLEVLSENELVTSQPVVVNVEESWDFKGFFDKNWKILGIGLLNLILIIAIIIVAVKAYRK